MDETIGMIDIDIMHTYKLIVVLARRQENLTLINRFFSTIKIGNIITFDAATFTNSPDLDEERL
jgi:hypothetical protein